MKASKLIEILREFDIDQEVCVHVGFNVYEIGKNIKYDPNKKLVCIHLDVDDVNNELGK